MGAALLMLADLHAAKRRGMYEKKVQEVWDTVMTNDWKLKEAEKKVDARDKKFKEKVQEAHSWGELGIPLRMEDR